MWLLGNEPASSERAIRALNDCLETVPLKIMIPSIDRIITQNILEMQWGTNIEINM